jgi:hypothetical protein
MSGAAWYAFLFFAAYLFFFFCVKTENSLGKISRVFRGQSESFRVVKQNKKNKQKTKQKMSETTVNSSTHKMSVDRGSAERHTRWRRALGSRAEVLPALPTATL